MGDFDWFSSLGVVAGSVFDRIATNANDLMDDTTATEDESTVTEPAGWPEHWITLADLLYGDAERPVTNRTLIDGDEVVGWG